MIRSIITDGTGRKNSVKVTEDSFLQVISKDYYKWDNYTAFFTNPIYGSNLSINASTSGSVENIHNGNDATYWTATSVVGTWDFSSTNQAYQGSQSIDATLTINNDVAQFTKGSDIDLSTYSAISGWIYIQGWSLVGVKRVTIQGWNVGVGAVGTAVDIGAFVSKSNLGVWQKFTIPLSTFGLQGATINAIRIDIDSTGGGDSPNFYLDTLDIVSVAGSGPGVQSFEISSISEKVIRVDKIAWNFVATGNPTLINATVPKLSYNALIGRTLESGFVYNRIQNSEAKSVIVAKDLLELTQLAGTYVENVFFDGTNVYLKVIWDFAEPQELRYPARDKLRITISDDLSDFEVIRVSIIGGLRSYVDGS